MAKKRDNASELAEKLLHALEAQRSRDREAYPLSIQQLAELAEPHVPWKLVERAIVTTSFSERACVALKKNPGAPVALSEDLEQLAAFPHLLVVTLEAVCTPARPAQPLNRMASKLDARLREPFEQVVTRQIREHTLPSEVGCQLVRNKPQLFLRRMPPPADPVVVLSERLVRSLETQRERGGDAYPPSLSGLLELTEPAALPSLVKKALGKEPFKSRAILALKTHPETPVALVEDRERLADSPRLLKVLLTTLRKETDQGFNVSKLKLKLPRTLQSEFSEMVNQRAETGPLAPGVGWLWSGGKRQFFLLEDVHGAGVLSPTPSLDFAALFDAAFAQLDHEGGGHNFVSLVPLRRAVALPRDDFDRGLHRLRREGRYTLSAAEGRHGITPEEQDAGVTEDGMLLLYVSRRMS